MLLRIIKFIGLVLGSVLVVMGLVVFLAIDCCLVQLWNNNCEIEKAKVVKKKRYEFDQMDYAGKGLQYEFRDGKFRLIKIQ